MRFVNRSMFLLVSSTILVSGCFHHRSAPKPSLNPLTATPQMVDSLWNAALDYYARHKWDKAAAAFDRLELEITASDKRFMLARMYLGELYVRSGSNLQGVREYRRLVDEYPTDSLAPEALLKAADAYNALWRGVDLDPTYGITAQSVYSEVVTRYPNTPAAAKAAVKLQELDDRFAIKAYMAGKFYLKYKAYESAIMSLSSVVVDHPKAQIVPSALADLIVAYRKLGYAEDIRDKCAYMKDHWAETPEYRKSCPATLPAAAEKPAGG